MILSKQIVSQLLQKPVDRTGTLFFKANICHKSKLPQKKVYHWPHDKYAWSWHNFYLDPFTTRKFNENSKLIQVDGNLGVGKQDFAKRLADELGMKYFPPEDLESYYINDHGYDYRALNPLLPERMRACDWQMFHENPARHSVIHMQYVLYKLRFYQLLKALRHIFNTGQGVVIARSVYTEKAIVDAMNSLGWLPKGYLRDDGARFYDWIYRYNYIRNASLGFMLKPHLTIYLDASVDVCMENLQKDPVERNSKAHVPEFLQAIETSFHDVILPKSEYYSHLLEYKYDKRYDDDELMDVVEDIGKLDFEYYENDTRFMDWGEKSSLWPFVTRRRLTSEFCMEYFDFMLQPDFDIAGLGDSITQVDLHLRDDLFAAHVGDFGHYVSKEADVNFTKSYLKAFISYLNFGQKMERFVRSDYA